MATLKDIMRKAESFLEDTQQRERIALVGATILLGSGVAGAYKATQDANALQRQREAITAAGTEIAQQPYVTGSNIGATGEVQISKGIAGWLPIALAFIVVMYVIFKD